MRASPETVINSWELRKTVNTIPGDIEPGTPAKSALMDMNEYLKVNTMAILLAQPPDLLSTRYIPTRHGTETKETNPETR